MAFLLEGEVSMGAQKDSPNDNFSIQEVEDEPTYQT